MKKIVILFAVIAAVLSSALFFSSDALAVNADDNSEFYSYLLECANSYQKEIDVTKYVKAKGWKTSDQIGRAHV